MPLRSIRPGGIRRLGGRVIGRSALRRAVDVAVSIEKAAKKGTPSSNHAAALALKPDLKKAVRNALLSLRSSIDTEGLEKAIAARDSAAVIAKIPTANVDAALRNVVQPVLLQMVVASGMAEAAKLKAPIRKATLSGAATTISFDYRSAEAIRYASTMTGNLITAIDDSQREAIRDLMGSAFSKGWPPREVAKLIATVLAPDSTLSIVGLTPQLAIAVANRYFAALDAAETKFGSVPGDVLDRIEADAARYADNLLDYRSEMIARTETIDASTQGQYALWDAGVAQGQLDPSTTAKQWIYTGSDERACDGCEALDGQTVGLDENFQSDDFGDVDGPPAHPMCRCTTGLVFGEEAAAALGDTTDEEASSSSEEEPQPEE